MSWGSKPWGTTPWGGSAPIIIPEDVEVAFIPLEPLADAVGVPPGTHVSFRITSSDGINPVTLAVAVGGTNYILGGLAQNGAIVSIVANAFDGVDVQIDLPGQLPLNNQIEVSISIRDVFGGLAVGSYAFFVGVGPRLLLVRNPQVGILLAQFNRAMRRDTNFDFAGNWKVSPVTDAAPLTITEVVGNAGLPDTALLRFEGGEGGGVYLLTVVNVVSQDGDDIEHGFNTAQFVLVLAKEVEPDIRLFNTIFGPIGLVQRLLTRRDIETHVVSRSLALGMDEVLRIKRQSLDGTLDRTGRPGRNRT